MKTSTDKFADMMLESDKQSTSANRLDQVADMVADMEKKLTAKIDEANKQLVDKLESYQQVSETVDEVINEEKENMNYEDNGREDLSSEE